MVALKSNSSPSRTLLVVASLALVLLGCYWQQKSSSSPNNGLVSIRNYTNPNPIADKGTPSSPIHKALLASLLGTSEEPEDPKQVKNKKRSDQKEADAASTNPFSLWQWWRASHEDTAPPAADTKKQNKKKQPLAILPPTPTTWYQNLFSDLVWLPSNIPIPGEAWLHRLATSDTVVVYEGTKYSSIYMAMLENAPLQHPCRNLNAYLNSWLFSPHTAAGLFAWTGLSSLLVLHYLLCYLRDVFFAMVIYYGTAALFHYFCYVYPAVAVPTFEGQGRPRPPRSIIWNQIRLAQSSIFLYILLVILDEWWIESAAQLPFGLRPHVYYTVEEMGGWLWYFAMQTVYFSVVEVGIYWMHRTLHTNKWLYKHVHMLHHQYNKPELLTPWASIAFHPLDGILQACPYVLALFVTPCHYATHLGLLFWTALWATYIHDAMDWNLDALNVMGSKYHTVHHTHYMYNFGQVFRWCDWFWGTLREPTGPTGVAVTTTTERGQNKRQAPATKTAAAATPVRKQPPRSAKTPNTVPRATRPRRIHAD